MKILIVNSYDVGGAAKACIRLHEGLLDKEIDSTILFKVKQKSISNSVQFKKLPAKKTKIQRIKLKIYRILKELKIIKPKPVKKQSAIVDRHLNLEMFSFPNSNFDITESELYKEADIINLHWVAEFLDYETFFKKNTKPVIWTLHDMNPFSGGEHFTEEFLGINKKGKPIKRVISESEKKIFSKNIIFKKNALKNASNLHIVVLCNWMKNEVKKSILFKDYPIHLIANGINTNVFKPREKAFSREILNIPQNKKVILFVSDSLINNRKGFAFLDKAFEELKKEDIFLCAIGKKNNLKHNNDNILELGSISDERLMSIAYSAADVFVIPSLMDNLPNTVLESIMCGTPVVGFPVGGIKDMIEDGVNGLLTKDISVASLVEALTLFLRTSGNYNCLDIRKRALKKYSQNVQSKHYINLFESIYNKLEK
jgi:glycosyltransferase involved in cell wall biosynthesis